MSPIKFDIEATLIGFFGAYHGNGKRFIVLRVKGV